MPIEINHECNAWCGAHEHAEVFGVANIATAEEILGHLQRACGQDYTFLRARPAPEADMGRLWAEATHSYEPAWGWVFRKHPVAAYVPWVVWYREAGHDN